MKIIFVSNYHSHHQSEFTRQFSLQKDVEFLFIETKKMSEERVNLGWPLSKTAPYIIDEHFFSLNYNLCQKWITEADIVILGDAPIKLLRERIKQRKPTFLYSERIYKKPCKIYKLPIHFLKFRKRKLSKKNVYMLCASAFTAADYSKTFMFLNRSFKWGYFPAAKKYNDIESLITKKEPLSILWAGRLIDWKHPDSLIEVAKRLKVEGHQFKLNIIGNGVMEQEMKNKILAANLDDCVHMLGAMKPEQVREYMERSKIFLLTSDRNEGWGAVLNESMNSACAVVASHAIGSVPFLIDDGKNGLIYKSGDIKDLYLKIKRLLENDTECVKIAKNAYKTIIKEWNAENAVIRFKALAQTILNGGKDPYPYESGICSKAKVLKDNWFI